MPTITTINNGAGSAGGTTSTSISSADTYSYFTTNISYVPINYSYVIDAANYSVGMMSYGNYRDESPKELTSLEKEIEALKTLGYRRG